MITLGVVKLAFVFRVFYTVVNFATSFTMFVCLHGMFFFIAVSLDYIGCILVEGY